MFPIDISKHESREEVITYNKTDKPGVVIITAEKVNKKDDDDNALVEIVA